MVTRKEESLLMSYMKITMGRVKDIVFDFHSSPHQLDPHRGQMACSKDRGLGGYTQRMERTVYRV